MENNLMKKMYTYFEENLLQNNTDNLVLQFLPVGEAINPADYLNLISPSNVEGQLGSNENLAMLVNKVPDKNIIFSASSNLDTVYSMILDNAKATKDEELNEDEKERYENAMKLLYVDNDLNQYSKRYNDYLVAVNNYENSQMEKSSALFELMMKYMDTNYQIKNKPLYQREQQMLARKYESLIREALCKKDSFKDIENAISTIQTTYRSGIKGYIRNQKSFLETSVQTSIVDGGANWHMTYAYPSNWPEAINDVNSNVFQTHYINEVTETKHDSDRLTEWNLKPGLIVGIFNGAGQTDNTKHEVTSDDVKEITGIKMDVAAIRIERPWLDETIFNIDGWSIKNHDSLCVSTGKFTKKDSMVKEMLPLIPKTVLIVKNVTLSGKFDSNFKEKVEKTSKTGATIGIGPFGIHGNLNVTNVSVDEKSNMITADITIPEAQVIGYISSIVKASPVDGDLIENEA